MSDFDRTLKEMSGGGASELVLLPGSARAHNDGSEVSLTDLPSMNRRRLESLIMSMAGTEKWARFMAEPSAGLDFDYRHDFRVAVRYEGRGPVMTVRVEAAA